MTGHFGTKGRRDSEEFGGNFFGDTLALVVYCHFWLKGEGDGIGLLGHLALYISQHLKCLYDLSHFSLGIRVDLWHHGYGEDSTISDFLTPVHDLST